MRAQTLEPSSREPVNLSAIVFSGAKGKPTTETLRHREIFLLRDPSS
jgi:hypothetical protein